MIFEVRNNTQTSSNIFIVVYMAGWWWWTKLLRTDYLIIRSTLSDNRTIHTHTHTHTTWRHKSRKYINRVMNICVRFYVWFTSAWGVNGRMNEYIQECNSDVLRFFTWCGKCGIYSCVHVFINFGRECELFGVENKGEHNLYMGRFLC